MSVASQALSQGSRRQQLLSQIKDHLQQKFKHSQPALEQIESIMTELRLKKRITPQDIQRTENQLASQYSRVLETFKGRSSIFGSANPSKPGTSSSVPPQSDLNFRVGRKTPSAVEKRETLDLALNTPSNINKSFHISSRKLSTDRDNGSNILSKRKPDLTNEYQERRKIPAKNSPKLDIDKIKRDGRYSSSVCLTPDKTSRKERKFVENIVSKAGAQSVTYRTQSTKFKPNQTMTDFKSNSFLQLDNPYLKQTHKPNIWGAILVHDTLKFKEEEKERRDKIRKEKEELKQFLFNQMKRREEEQLKRIHWNKRADEDALKGIKGIDEKEQDEYKKKRRELSKMMREEYEKNFERIEVVRKQKTEEHQKDWSTVLKEREFFHDFQKNEKEVAREKEKKFRRQLEDLIKQRQEVREVEKRLERRMELDTLDFQARSVEQRNQHLRSMKEKLNQKNDKRENLFLKSSNNFALMEQRKFNAYESKIEVQHLEQVRKRDEKESIIKKRKESLQKELMAGLQEMSEEKKIREKKVKESIIKDKFESKRLFQDFRKQMQLEQKRLQEEKLAKKELMHSQFKTYMTHKRQQNVDGTLTPKEFEINKNLMKEMGVATSNKQEQIATGYIWKREEINPKLL